MGNLDRKRISIYLALSAVTISLTAACMLASGSEPPLQTARQVDLKRYQGKWYEIGRLPLSWEKKCAGDVTATYTLRPDGKIDVLNMCRRANGKLTQSKGTAKPATKGGNNAKLKVTFFWPFAGDYWILDFDPEYRWSLVGTPNRKYLWLLSRTRQLPEQTVELILKEAQRLGFDTSGIIHTKQT